MPLRTLSCALTGALLAALAHPVFAQDKSGTNIDPMASSTPSGPAAMISLARDLYDVGLAQGDALTVLAAARFAASVSFTSAEPAALDPAKIIFIEAEQESLRKIAAPSADPGPPAPMLPGGLRPAAKASFFTVLSNDEGPADAPVTAAAMFAKATDLAPGDEAILRLIEGAMAEGSSGRAVGAAQWLARLPAGQTDVWEIPFYGNSYSEIAVVGDGDTNLDMAITDENGNVLCLDASWSDSLYCDFTPAWDGFFYVTVQNLGNLRNSYHLITN